MTERESEGFVAEDPRIVRALRAEQEREVTRRDWSDFSAVVVRRIEAIEEPQLEAADVAELHASSEREVAARDWAAFSTGIAAQIDALSEPLLPVDVSNALRAASTREVSSRDAEWSAFTARVLARVEAEISAELERPSDVGALVRGDAERAVAERDWDRFSDVPKDETEQLREEVRSELAAMEPGFGGAFRAQVERRIRSHEPPRREREPRAAHRSRRRFAPLVIAAVAAALALFVLPSQKIDPTSELPSTVAFGEVSIDEVSFEGQVVITHENGVPVMWLPGAS